MATTAHVYDIGDSVRISFNITSTVSSTDFVNSRVKLVVDRPLSTSWIFGPTSSTSSTEISNTTVGKWLKDIAVNEPGRWAYQVYSTGTVVVSEYGAFAVRSIGAST